MAPSSRGILAAAMGGHARTLPAISGGGGRGTLRSAAPEQSEPYLPPSEIAGCRRDLARGPSGPAG
eukprot:1698263-Pyramimonas_sp.AAC.1